MENTEAQVRLALDGVIDPETGLSVMRMDLIHDLAVGSDGSVSLIFRPSSPICPMAYSLANSIKTTIEAVNRVSAVNIRIENYEKAEHLENLLKSPRTNSRRKEN
jgi:metal-sulfur cluster biosynthetic enzyme